MDIFHSLPFCKKGSLRVQHNKFCLWGRRTNTNCRQTECRAHLSSAYSDALLALSNDVGATQSIIDGCREERDGAHPLMPIKPLFEGPLF